MERLLDKQLEKLRSRVLKMFTLAEEQVELVIRSIEEDNPDLMTAILNREERVDRYDIKIEKICQRIFALHQPVALDLRYIIAVININRHIERIGDLAVKIGRHYIALQGRPAIYEKTRLPALVNLASTMLRDVINAFIEKDCTLSASVIGREVRAKAKDEETYAVLIKEMQQGNSGGEREQPVEKYVILLEMSRAFKRLSEHTTDIAEDIIFIYEGHYVRHHSADYAILPEDEDDE